MTCYVSSGTLNSTNSTQLMIIIIFLISIIIFFKPS